MAVAKTVEHSKTVLVTAEELWQLSESGQKYELVKGHLLDMTPPGGTHGKVALRIGRFVQSFVDENDLGEVMVETGFRLVDNPDTVRSPDASFLAADKLSTTGLPDGFISGAPDLAIEVVSPGDTASEIQDKVHDYLTYGAQLIWVIYPQQKIVVVHHPDGTAKTLHEKDTLTGESVVPGFSCPVGDIFS